MRTLNEFRLTSVDTKSTKSDNYEGYPNIKTIIKYEDWVEIALLENGNHFLVVDRWDLEGPKEELEEHLWDWVKFENGVSIDDMTEDLHERCRNLMEELDEKYSRDTHLSLDEYQSQFRSTLTELEDDKITYLLNQFCELN